MNATRIYSLQVMGIVRKMLIQNFAENAVKHAFQEVDYMGKIEIKCMLDEDKNVCISIIDNGIGIEKSSYGWRKLWCYQNMVIVFNTVNAYFS